MNKQELKVEMLRHHDTGIILASILGITNSTFSNKLNQKGAEFTQSEILAIKERYGLTSMRVEEIFFNSKVS